MEIIVELLLVGLQFLGEILLQLLFEGFVEYGAHKLKGDHQSQPTNPWLALIGYAMLGAVIGGISAWILPNSFITSEPLRIANLIVTPIAAGAVMTAVGVWRAKRGDEVLYINRFAYGFIFALAMTLTRFILVTAAS